ncbi:helix-turn-helix transcriptional regulator [Microbulbifer hydrolyticus]|uniref:DNA-binding CsgD family transcriptional regulator n=1 Tax=Microbulbifer hydrolyticus TaxID=48074 RepID=A0A6P1TDH3_9GAMM|nr:LuxR C-terminal-related transcriptional regulator [Microbulbifer hydrolyticus]MBB5212436.1 DNA-binding CsgD family transcriptional regulator [Microbulbifer hydrolyticus]QHQ40067.1 helix-turn-helix transcriptional regulator [Microbulbifer hydrolyticus]
MPFLFLSDSGLHGDLLFSLISEQLPLNWEKSEFGKQKHCLNTYDAIVVNCFVLTSKSTPCAEFNYIRNINHPKVLLINVPCDLSTHISGPLEERKFAFLCDSNTGQQELIHRLESGLRSSRPQEDPGYRTRLLLTKREQEILAQLTTGEPNSIIASRLHLSEHTVKNHMYNIFRKIGVKNRLQASNWAKLHLEVERT